MLNRFTRSPRTASPHARGEGRLRDLEAFGSNPGNLRALIHIPADAAPDRPLVVVLHGCTQNAQDYDRAAGWSTVADEQGFALLFPEQRRANNPNLCFNWFAPEDTKRDQGEVLSIRQMIAELVANHGIDPARVFITGLSAGGAMTSAMLATYPELFAGGAIIAGLPYGTARGVPQALDRMRGQGLPDAGALDALVRNASPHSGPWPTISVWHGDSDATVHRANADAIVAQWRALHGVATAPSAIDSVDGQEHRVWRDAAGRPVIEQYEIAGMGHGTPLRTSGADACGAATAFMLDVGISSTRHLTNFWGLADRTNAAKPTGRAKAEPTPASGSPLPVPRTVRPERIYTTTKTKPATKGVGQIIEDALRAAGLMR